MAPPWALADSQDRENESGEYDSAFAKLARAGIRISYYSSSTGF